MLQQTKAVYNEYEYRVIKIKTLITQQEVLNKFGKKGWRLVSVLLNIDKGYVYYFVRELFPYFQTDGEIFEINENEIFEVDDNG